MLRFLGAFFFIFASVGIFASAETFRVPMLTGPVVDQAQLLTQAEQSKLENALEALRAAHDTQLQVLIMPDLAGLTIEEASIKITDKWQLGNKKTDRGVLLLVAVNERRVRIEVGQGLEGVLTDAFSSRIIRETITPLFKAGDYFSGIMLGVYQIAHLTDPDFEMQPYLESVGEPSGRTKTKDSKLEFILFFILFFIVMIFNRLTPRRLLSRSSSYGGFGGSGWGGSSRSGGNWSGGGGGFSGGGASGSW